LTPLLCEAKSGTALEPRTFSPDLRPILRAFCAGFIRHLEVLKVWPRPAGLAWPHIGDDYFSDDLSSFPESAPATQLLFEHEWLRPMYASQPMNYGPNQFIEILRPFAERVAAWTAAGHSFNRSFDVWYRRLLSELRKPTVKIIHVTAIPEFRCALTRVPLDETSSLERIGGYLT
jgi:hypothetical protein